MQNDQYETWLAKQEAMGRSVPATTSEYRPPAHPGQNAIDYESIHIKGCPHNYCPDSSLANYGAALLAGEADG